MQMCDRYSLTKDLAEVRDYFQIDQVAFHYTYRDRISPTEHIPVVVHRNNARTLEQFRWGLMPFWAKDSIRVSREHVQEKPAFNRLFARNRCVIPCDSFYEEETEGKLKRQVRFSHRYGGVFGMAGIYDVRVNSFGEEIRTCTLITEDEQQQRLPSWGTAGGAPSRKPVVLHESSFDAWLNPRLSDRDILNGMMRQSDADHYVSTVYNDNVKP